MKKTMNGLKRIMTLLLAAAMIATSIPQGVMAAEPAEAESVTAEVAESADATETVSTEEENDSTVEESSSDESEAESDASGIEENDESSDQQESLTENENRDLYESESELHNNYESIVESRVPSLDMLSNSETKVYKGFISDGGSIYSSNSGPEKLVDNDSSNWWMPFKGYVDGEEGQYFWTDFHSSSPIEINEYGLLTYKNIETDPNANPSSWRILAKYNADDDWTVIAEVNNDDYMQAKNSTEYVYTLDAPGTYQYFRFLISETIGNNYYVLLSEMSFYYEDIAQYDILINKSEGGKVTAENTKVEYRKKVSLTIIPETGYILDGISINDKNGNDVRIVGGKWYDGNTVSFWMPQSNVTVIPSFTNKMHTAEDGLSICIPQSGQIKAVIPDSVMSFKVYDHAGPDANYVYSCDGSLVCYSSGSKFMIEGYVNTDDTYSNNKDLGLSVYDGDNIDKERIGWFYSDEGNGIDKKAGPLVGSEDSICIRHRGGYSFDEISEYYGVDLTVSRLLTGESYSLSIKAASGGSVSSTNSTTDIIPGTKITLNVNPDSGYLLQNLIVKEENGKDVVCSGGLWCDKSDKATFGMPRSNVMVTPVFTNAKTAEDGLTYMLPPGNSASVVIPEGVTSFRIADNGEFSRGKNITVQAPSGKKLCVCGRIKVTDYDHGLDIFDGEEETDGLITHVSNWYADDEGISPVPTSLSTNNKITLRFGTNNNVFKMVDLTVSLVDPEKDYDVTVKSAQNGSVVCAGSAKAGSTVEFTVNPDTGALLSDIKIMSQTGEEIPVTGGRWYESGEKGTFLMPPYPVTLQPVFTKDWSAEGGLYINMPGEYKKDVLSTATIPEGVRSFKIYDDGGPDRPYLTGGLSALKISAGLDHRVRLSGMMWFGDHDMADKIVIEHGYPFYITDGYYEDFHDMIEHGLFFTDGIRYHVPYDMGTFVSEGSDIYLEHYAYKAAAPDAGIVLTAEILTPSSFTESPKAVNNLVYNGKPQILVTAGKANSGQIYYALTENGGLKPADEDYSALIPTGVDSGSYDVWYKIISSGEYGDSLPAKIMVTIAPAEYPAVEQRTISGVAYPVMKVIKTEIDSGRTNTDVSLGLPVLPVGSEYTGNILLIDESDWLEGRPAVDKERGIVAVSTKKYVDGRKYCEILAEVSFAKNHKNSYVCLHIDPVVFDDSIWIETVPDQDYTGSAIKPVPVVHFKNAVLDSNDYTVSYKNNTNAADRDDAKAPLITVKGKVNYAGTASATFTISKLDLKDAVVPDVILAYNKRVQKAKSKVNYDINGKKVTLKEGKDYTLIYAADPKEPGEYLVKVTGIGNYTGETSYMIRITEPEYMISKIKVPSIPAQMYSGKFIVFNDSEVVSSDALTRAVIKKSNTYEDYDLVLISGDKALTYGKDYTLAYKDNCRVGTATVTITGIGNYIGSRDITFKINGIKFSSAKNDGKFIKEKEIDGYGNVIQYDYDNCFYIIEGKGKDAKRYNLIKNRDYTVTYKNNKNAGTATVTYTGIGRFYGSVTKKFTVSGIKMSSVKIPDSFDATEGKVNNSIGYSDYLDGKNTFIYTGYPYEVAGTPAQYDPVTDEWSDPADEHKRKDEYGIILKGVDLTGKPHTLAKNVDYVVTYENNIEPGTATVTFTGIGNYYGSVKKKFKIKSRDLTAPDSITVRFPDDSFYWDEEEGYVPVYNFEKGGNKPEPIVIYKFGTDEKVLENGSDYTLKWSNNNKIGSFNAKDKKNKSIAPSVEINFKGCFSGKVIKTFTIKNGLFGNASVSDVAYQKDKAGLHTKTSLTVKDNFGQVLKAGTDYYKIGDKKNPVEFKFKSFEYGTKAGEDDTGIVSVKSGKNWTDKEVKVGDDVLSTYCIPAGTEIEATIRGKGNYEGRTITTSFFFGPADISKAAVTIPDMAYNVDAYTADAIGNAMRVSMIKGGELLKYGDDFTISYIEDKAGTGKVNLTIKGVPAKGYSGEKKTAFKIVARQMNDMIRYDANAGGADSGLYGALLAKNVVDGKDLEWYKANYRINGTMKDSLIPVGGKLTKNTYKIEKYNESKKKWAVVPAAEISFAGWNTKADGSGTSLTDQSVYKPSWFTRLRYGSDLTLYAQWEIK